MLLLASHPLTKTILNTMLEKLSHQKKHQLLGELFLLLLSSDLHLKYQVGDVANNFLPPIDLGQFRIYKKGERPVAFISWAFLDEETENKYINKQYDLQIGDWNKGDRLWFIDFIGPFGDIDFIEKDLAENIFPHSMAKALRADSSGKVFKVQEYFGINYKK